MVSGPPGAGCRHTVGPQQLGNLLASMVSGHKDRNQVLVVEQGGLGYLASMVSDHWDRKQFRSRTQMAQISNSPNGVRPHGPESDIPHPWGRACMRSLNGVRPLGPESGDYRCVYYVCCAASMVSGHWDRNQCYLDPRANILQVPQWCPATRTGISQQPEPVFTNDQWPQWCPAAGTGIRPARSRGCSIRGGLNGVRPLGPESGVRRAEVAGLHYEPQWCPAT